MKLSIITQISLPATFGLASTSIHDEAVISGMSFGNSHGHVDNSQHKLNFKLENVAEPVNYDGKKLSPDFPAIALPYGIWHPSLTDDSEELGYLHYRNIRYGQSPVGALRSAPPVSPESITGELPEFDGSWGHSCHQAAPQWLIDVFEGGGKDWEEEFRTEKDGDDCLFLDVAMPSDTKSGDKLPVLVWIYGGGYDTQPFIYIALSYRMGAHGFLGGRKFVDQGGQSNLGLYDQRLALQWVQDHIHRFGGDRSKVTVMGESAGAGSIVYHLIWNDTNITPNTPFKKAIIQSPAWLPAPGSQAGLVAQDTTYDRFLGHLKATDLSAARAQSEQEVRDANRALVNEAPYGSFNAGPVVDGSTILDNPLELFRAGVHDTSVEIFTGDVGAEGLPFVPAKLYNPLKPDWTDANIKDYIKAALPLFDDETAQVILDEYDPYWPAYIGPSPQTQRWAAIVGQALVQCNARGILTAYGNDTYNYLFKMPKYNQAYLPLFHGQDVPYTFFNVPSDDEKLNVEAAENWQKYIMGFVLDSNPNLLKPKIDMVKYGEEAHVIEFDKRDIWNSVIKKVVDPYKVFKCDSFWPAIWELYGDDKAEKVGETDQEELR